MRSSAKLPTIGFLGPNTPAARSQSAAAFVQRLREFGWIEQSECKLFGTVVTRLEPPGASGSQGASELMRLQRRVIVA